MGISYVGVLWDFPYSMKERIRTVSFKIRVGLYVPQNIREDIHSTTKNAKEATGLQLCTGIL